MSGKEWVAFFAIPLIVNVVIAVTFLWLDRVFYGDRKV
jgi:hypothetical protein